MYTYSYNPCTCMVSNSYRHPTPQPKRRRFMTTIDVEKFTINRVKDSCIEKCCEPIQVGVSAKKSVLVLHGITECIQPDTYYTFDLDRSVPLDYNALQVFIKAEPCEFFHGQVDLEETEITVPFHKFPNFKFTEADLCEIYQAKYHREDSDEEGHCHHNRKVEHFIEVDLDLRGNIATSGYFLRNERTSDPVYGPKYRYVLYMNNAGRLVLSRDKCETRKYGDFDL